MGGADGIDLEELARTVQWLRDVEEIKMVPQRYARGLDTKDFDSARAQFSDDCFVTGSLNQDHIDPYWAKLIPSVEVYQATMHFMGNQFVDHEPGSDTAFVETYAVAYHLERPGTGLPDLTMGVRYQDTLGRRGDGWVITARTSIPQWYRGPLPRPADAP
jgi:hypothetical protein